MDKKDLVVSLVLNILLIVGIGLIASSYFYANDAVDEAGLDSKLRKKTKKANTHAGVGWTLLMTPFVGTSWLIIKMLVNI